MNGSSNDNGGKGNGSNVTIIELLERIARGVENTNVRVDVLAERVDKGFTDLNLRIDGTNNRIDATNERVDLGFADLSLRIDGTNNRIDNVLHFVGSHHSDHEERIRVLEEVVLAKKKA